MIEKYVTNHFSMLGKIYCYYFNMFIFFLFKPMPFFGGTKDIRSQMAKSALTSSDGLCSAIRTELKVIVAVQHMFDGIEEDGMGKLDAACQAVLSSAEATRYWPTTLAICNFIKATMPWPATGRAKHAASAIGILEFMCFLCQEGHFWGFQAQKSAYLTKYLPGLKIRDLQSHEILGFFC